jgi:hypothetical protein
MKEKLQQYALIAEIISAIAIVLSLIFVGLQVRQGAEETAANSEAIRSQVRQAMLETDLGLLNSANDVPEIITSMQNIPEDLQGRAFLFFTAFIRTRENYWLQHNKGLIDNETYQSYLRVFINNIKRSRYYRKVWDFQRAILNPAFVAEINTILESDSIGPVPDLP